MRIRYARNGLTSQACFCSQSNVHEGLASWGQPASFNSPLDEWLAGLNPSELAIGIALIERLSRQGRTIIMVEHVMDAIRTLCGRCLVMSSGRSIREGDVDEVLSDPEVVRAYLGDDDA